MAADRGPVAALSGRPALLDSGSGGARGAPAYGAPLRRSLEHVASGVRALRGTPPRRSWCALGTGLPRPVVRLPARAMGPAEPVRDRPHHEAPVVEGCRRHREHAGRCRVDTAGLGTARTVRPQRLRRDATAPGRGPRADPRLLRAGGPADAATGAAVARAAAPARRRATVAGRVLPGAR